MKLQMKREALTKLRRDDGEPVATEGFDTFSSNLAGTGDGRGGPDAEGKGLVW